MQPIEMCRKRLAIQRIDAFKLENKGPEMDTIVETHPEPLHGLFDCMLTIIREEGSVKFKKSKKISNEDWHSVYGGEKETSTHGFLHSVSGIGLGIRSLYRGFWPRYLRSCILFISNEITDEERW